MAWEHEATGGTYGAPRIHRVLRRAGVVVGMQAVAASMRCLDITGLNTHPRRVQRGGRGIMAHEDHCVRQWDKGTLDRVRITDFTYLRCAQGWCYMRAVQETVSMGSGRSVLG